ncbi:hypothetical protein AWC38_SpisGene24458 [Stylophora pistillata]|uniref:Uncharacterized protein n=1 Tax=Stylophora pistillata TaxID=50429 RepID=A0A2B4R656_STYPI|nr:hypothetical protein AWC38_SpisGene24458 [Stylophora pistillata]
MAFEPEVGHAGGQAAGRALSKQGDSGERAELLDTTNLDWAPTINLGHNKIKIVSLAVARNARDQKRNETKQKYDEITSSSTTQDSGVEEVIGGLQPISRDRGYNGEKNKCWWTNKSS